MNIAPGRAGRGEDMIQKAAPSNGRKIFHASLGRGFAGLAHIVERL